MFANGHLSHPPRSSLSKRSLFVLISPAGPVAGPVPGVWCVWSDVSSVLRFCPGTDSLTLTVQQASGGLPRDGIRALRERLEDVGVLNLVRLQGTRLFTIPAAVYI